LFFSLSKICKALCELPLRKKKEGKKGKKGKKEKKKRIKNLEIIDFIVHYKDSKQQLWGQSIGVVKLKNCQVPPFL
jgi:hypothetical protein